MPYQSVGGAATGALLDALAERERSKQQALQNQRLLMQDQLARDKEAREAQYQRDEIANRQQQLAQDDAKAKAGEERAKANDFRSHLDNSYIGGDIITDAGTAAEALQYTPDRIQVKQDPGAVGPVPEGQMPVGSAIRILPNKAERAIAQAKAESQQADQVLAQKYGGPEGLVRARANPLETEMDFQAAHKTVPVSLLTPPKETGYAQAEGMMAPGGPAVRWNTTLGRYEDTLSGQPVAAQRRPFAAQAAAGQAGVAASGAPPTVDPNAPTGADYLKTLNPNDASVVKSLAEGRQAFPTGTALRTPYWQDMVKRVYQYDPSMDTATISNNNRSKVRQDFTSGKSADQIRALNTAVGHLDQLDKLTDALHNSDWKVYNTVANSLMSNTSGWTGQTDFDTVASHVAEELTRIWRGTGGNEADIKRELDSLNSSRPPKQLHSAIGNLGGLVESQVDSLRQRQEQGLGIAATIPVASPEARKTLDRFAGRQTPTSGATAPVSGDVIDAAAWLAARKKKN